ncbi:hypothetical protein [uncultured Ruegeria sp.]|nr:hypothetical protein [uncultured Ruegeria sp.]
MTRDQVALNRLVGRFWLKNDGFRTQNSIRAVILAHRLGLEK